MAITACLIVMACLGAVYFALARQRLGPVAIYIYVSVLFFLVRPLLLAFGLDAYFFEPWGVYVTNPDEAIGYALFYVTLWFLSFLAFYLLAAPIAPKIGLAFPHIAVERNVRMAFLILVGVTMINVVFTAYLFAKYGGIQAAVVAIRFRFELAGFSFLRLLPAVSAYYAAALFVAIAYLTTQGHRMPLPKMQLMVGSLLIVTVFCNLPLGDRDNVVFPFIAMLFAYSMTIYRARDSLSFGRRVRVLRRRVTFAQVVGIGVALMSVPLIMLYLRNVAADQATTGVLFAGPARTVTSALNLNLFDSLMLVVADWDLQGRYRAGQDFVNGVIQIVPRFLWPEKPGIITVDRWFKHEYTGATVGGGWPITGVGEWLLNFGVAGVIVGGAITGVLFRALKSRYADLRTNAVSNVFVFLIVVKIVPFGFDAAFPSRFILWLGPFWIFALILGRYRAAGAAGVHALHGLRAP